MKILLVCMEYDYGIKARGKSYEYYNFYQNLIQDGHDVELFDYVQMMENSDKTTMNQQLIEKVKEFRPHLALFSLYTDQLIPTYVEKVREYTKTFCFFHDDTWRKDFSQAWAKHFDFFSSPDYECKEKYRRLGLNNVIHFPFGANHYLYTNQFLPKLYDVSFVGGWHPVREWLIKRIQRNGINVHVVGHGWPNGIVKHEEMVRIFNQSKINLNFSNSTSWDARYLLNRPKAIKDNMKSSKTVEQMKARMFEINACGGFQLSYYVEGLEHAYEIGKELGVYLSPEDLVEKIKYYLEDDLYREEIALKGYKNTLEKHTYSKRFESIFNEIGLS